MQNKLFWAFFTLISVVIFILVYKSPVLNYGGDIAEYHGITETILKSKSLALTPVAENNLKQYLPPSYFTNPGYYITGSDGNRYPVHFVWYSILALPMRIVLHLFSVNELQSLRLTNVLILIATLFVLFRFFVQHPFKRLVLLLATIFSPLVFFLTWPGPDIYYLSLLTIGVFAFFRKNYLLASFLIALSSWHSQPLLVLSALVGIYALFMHIKNSQNTLTGIKTSTTHLLKLQFVGTVLAVPILYNLIYFGKWSPWTVLQDGWTIMNGFGLHNASLQKLFEQFFDLNFGLFFYAPLLILTGLIFFIRYIKNRDVVFLFIAFLITCFFYQTNPAWHYGTAGFGPSRHAIFLLPLFIATFVFFIKNSWKYYIFLALFLATQIPLLYMNGFTTPKLENTLQNSPIAEYVLNKWPSAYNPTPEIFVDRTNHTDLDYPSSAIFKSDETCKKAYILKSDKKLFEDTCGPIPQKYTSFFDDEFLNKSSTTRTVKTNEATFWPDTPSCAEGYQGPFKCMKNIQDAAKYTGVSASSNRLTNLENGVWKLNFGTPTTIQVPAGYIIQYRSFEGIYINL